MLRRRHDAAADEGSADIVEVSIRLRIHAGQPQLEGIGDGSGYDQLAAPIDGFELVPCPPDDFKLVSRVCRAQRDHATGAALAIEQRLRPLEDLDLTDVEQPTVEGQAVAERQAVNVERDRLIDTGIL